MTHPPPAHVPHFLAGAYLDRRSDEREHPEAIARARMNPRSRVLLTKSTALAVYGDPPRAAFLAVDDPLLSDLPDEDFVLLGWFEQQACLMTSLPPGVPTPTGWHYEELRPLAGMLDRNEAGLLAYARAIKYWQLRHRHCGRCGGPTVAQRAGHVRRCMDVACAEVFFPRIDPAIIVLVNNGERALLGRQASWPEGRFSTIAGFVEPGESLEDAVAREVAEETAVNVQGVVYHSSQPWPFPSSLMLGFMAEAAPGATIAVGAELADAQWFSREDIAEQRIILPPSTSISYRLIETWFDAYDGPPLRSWPTGTWGPINRAS